MREAIGALAALGAISISTAAFAQGYAGGYRGSYAGGYPGSRAPPMQSAKPVDNIGDTGQFVIGVERLSALSFDSMTTDFPAAMGGKQTQKSTGFALLGNSYALGGTTLSSVPRLGFDYFVIDGLSLGTSLGYMQLSLQQEQGGQSQDLGTQDTVLFAPRIGYALQFGDTFSFWPRAGVTYANVSSKSSGGGGADSAHFLDVTVEPLFGISPVSHFVIAGGPYLDLGVGGAGSTGSSDIGEKATSFGLTFGLAGYI